VSILPHDLLELVQIVAKTTRETLSMPDKAPRAEQKMQGSVRTFLVLTSVQAPEVAVGIGNTGDTLLSITPRPHEAKISDMRLLMIRKGKGS
jgi:hypothetical protein